MRPWRRDAGCDPTSWDPFQLMLVPLDPATFGPLPSTPALSGVLETLAFLRDPDFARTRFERYGDRVETRLLGQRTVFIRGGQAIGDLFAQGDAGQGWWPDSVPELLGPLSLANSNGADQKARRRMVGQLFASAALKRYSPSIVALVNELSQRHGADPEDLAIFRPQRH
jgi:cytochrome P450